MRLSRLLKLSFVGSLLFTPAMAQETDKVHEEALRVLRSGSATTNAAAAPAAVAPGARGPETRAERSARLRAEAQQRLAERERLQAQKREQFQEYVRERERMRSGAAPGTVHDQALKTLRQQTEAGNTASAVTPAPAATATPAPAATAPAARPVPAVQPQPAQAPTTPTPAARPAPPQSSNNNVQQRALDIVREQREQPSSAAGTPVRESELAPRTLATPSARNNTADKHQQALEVLRQQTGQSSTAPAAAAQPATTARQDDLKPSPELQRRLDEMNKELNTPPPRATTQADNEYTRELEQRALQMMQNQNRATPAAVTAAPASSTPTVTRSTTPAANNSAQEAERAREAIRRQEEQLRRQSSGVASSAPVSRPVTTPPAARSNAVDPAAEQRAREILRQQQQAVSNTSTAPTTAATTPPPAASVRSTSPAPATDTQYSQDLENRARQALLARAQDQPNTAAPQAETAQQAATAASSGNISTAPVYNPEIDRLHSRAYETLVQVEPGEAGQARLKSKQERLRALTDLYKADRMTPAEYHQRRAAILAEPNK